MLALRQLVREAESNLVTQSGVPMLSRPDTHCNEAVHRLHALRDGQRACLATHKQRALLLHHLRG